MKEEVEEGLLGVVHTKLVVQFVVVVVVALVQGQALDMPAEVPHMQAEVPHMLEEQPLLPKLLLNKSSQLR